MPSLWCGTDCRLLQAALKVPSMWQSLVEQPSHGQSGRVADRNRAGDVDCRCPAENGGVQGVVIRTGVAASDDSRLRRSLGSVAPLSEAGEADVRPANPGVAPGPGAGDP